MQRKHISSIFLEKAKITKFQVYIEQIKKITKIKLNKLKCIHMHNYNF